MIKYIYSFALVAIFISSLVSCSMNDTGIQYQKDLVYDGYNRPMDTLFIETYSISDLDSLSSGKLYRTITKWYDYAGYNSMTKSVLYTSLGEHETLEQITRDQNSLPIARDISVKSPNSETAVTLARLKKRKEGKEEWLFRYYLDPQKYLEDKSYVYYTADSRITKKEEEATDSLYTIEIDTFDHDSRLLKREPSESSKEMPYLMYYYNDKGVLDSLVSKMYEDNDKSKKLIKHYTEVYKYQLDDTGNTIQSLTYRNDSLISVSKYRYAYRK